MDQLISIKLQEQEGQVLERTAGQLLPNPRVLVTASNKVGINPIINQRILAAALRPRRVAEFSPGRSPAA